MKSQKVFFYDEENHSFGMSYINQFVICEDDQIECSGAFEINSEPNTGWKLTDGIQRSIACHFESENNKPILIL